MRGEHGQGRGGEGERTWAEIDLGALAHNVGLASAGGRGVMAVVKANAYGHGAVAMGLALEAMPGVAMLGVACLGEAGELRAGGVRGEIFLLGPCLAHERAAAVDAGHVVSLSSWEEAEAFAALGRGRGLAARAHVMVDTGMGREGFLEREWGGELIGRLLALAAGGGLELEGLASHLPAADEDMDFTLGQVGRFVGVVEEARRAGWVPRHLHLENSAGLMRKVGGVELSLARPGLMLYGIAPEGCGDGLRRVMSLRSRISLVRELPAGHGVSYGRTAITARATLLATVAVGYGDGYRRHLSGRGACVLVRGERCPLLGRVTMDQVMIDLSDHPMAGEIRAGEAVTLFGRDGAGEIGVVELAERAGTIPWEILTGIAPRVKRIYHGGGGAGGTGEGVVDGW
jgi:alanine racemase